MSETVPAELDLRASEEGSGLGLRVFSAPPGQHRFRRATDTLLLLPALIALVLLVVAYPPSVFEQRLDSFFGAVPGWVNPFWRFLYDVLAVWAIALVVAVTVGRRWGVLRDALVAFVLGLVVALVSARFALGHWPAFWDAIKSDSRGPRFPAVLVAEMTAVVITVNPQLVRPLQLVGRWVVVAGMVGVLVSGLVTPGGTIAGFLIAVVAASSVRLAFGTSAGRPEVPRIAGALRALGVTAAGLTVAERQSAGVFTVGGFDSRGRQLLVKVYGRDAYDTQLAAKLWRKVLYQDGGPRLSLSRGQAVEHEALLTLLARNAGVPTRTVVTAGETRSGDAMLVFRDPGTPLSRSSRLDEQMLGRSWRSLALLHEANVAHLQIDLDSVATFGEDVGIVDFAGATVEPTPEQLETDRAQLLATTAVAADPDLAVRAAIDSLGSDRVAGLLAYLQPAALRTPLRAAVKAAGIDMEQFRATVADAADAELPELVKLRRVTWWTIAQVVLMVLAAIGVINFATTIDWATLRTDLADANWGWLAFGFVLAQVARLAQATSSLGSIPADLPFGRVYMKQLATSYLNLAMPSQIGRIAIDIRFFQRQGLPGPASVTAGMIDSTVNNLVQIAILALLVVFTDANISLDLNAPSGDSLRLLWILIALLVLVGLVIGLVKRLRRAITDRLRTWWPQLRFGFATLHSPQKLAMLIGGNIAGEILFALALGLFARGLGYPISIQDVLAINISVSLLSSLLPIPGGIGVSEFGLTLGLTAAGMPESAALAAVLLYRFSTFYLPPIWGFFAMRWLQRNRYI